MNKKNSYESKSDNIQKKPSSRRNYIIEENWIIYIERRIYISNNWKIQEQILWNNYELADIGHPG